MASIISRPLGVFGLQEGSHELNSEVSQIQSPGLKRNPFALRKAGIMHSLERTLQSSTTPAPNAT